MTEIQPTILFEDDFIIAINKPAGMLVQADKKGEKGIAQTLGKNLGIIHRLDRPASGILLLAKKKWALANLNEQFKERQVVKKYWAVVQNKPKKESGRLQHYLRKNQEKNLTYAFDKPLHHTQEAVLEYRFLESIERYHLLEIDLKTGRHHQIRTQLKAIGSPIKGDVKYGFRRGNRDRSIHLHACSLQFSHPESGETMLLKAPAPEEVVWKAFKSIH